MREGPESAKRRTKLCKVEAESLRHPGPRRVIELLDRLDTIEDGVGRTRVPLLYSDTAYNLKLHIDLVRTKLQRAENRTETAPDS